MLWYREVRLEQSQPLGSLKSIILSNTCLTIYLSSPHSSPHLVTAWLSSKQTTRATIWKQTEKLHSPIITRHIAPCSSCSTEMQVLGSRVTQHKPKVGRFLQNSSTNFPADEAARCDELRASAVNEGRTSHRRLFSTPIPPEEPCRPAGIWAVVSAGGHHATRKEKWKKCVCGKAQA